MFSKKADINEVKETVLEEVMDGYTTDVKDVSEKVYYSLGAQNSKDGIVTVLFMYAGGTQIDFTYKAVSSDPFLQDDYVFMAIDDPSDSLRNDQSLPAISGMMPIDEENPTPRIFNFSGLQKVHYFEVIKALLSMVPGKWESYEQEMLAKRYKKQNPTGDSSESRSIPRVFKEIRNQRDFNEICKSHKTCAIALLPAITTIDYERESFEQKIAMLEKLD